MTIRSFNTRNLSAAGIARKISICTFSAAGWVSLGGTGIVFPMYHTIHPHASVVRIAGGAYIVVYVCAPMPIDLCRVKLPARCGVACAIWEGILAAPGEPLTMLGHRPIDNGSEALHAASTSASMPKGRMHNSQRVHHPRIASDSWASSAETHGGLA